MEIGLTYKDLTLSLRIFGRIAELFVASFHDTFQPTHQLMQRFLVLVSACLKQFSIHHDSEDYVKLTREAYAVLLSFAPWLVVFQQNARPDVEGMSKFDALCSAIVSNCVVSLRAEVASVVMGARSFY